MIGTAGDGTLSISEEKKPAAARLSNQGAQIERSKAPAFFFSEVLRGERPAGTWGAAPPGPVPARASVRIVEGAA